MERAIEEYLERQRLERIAVAYRSAYAQKPGELMGWSDEGQLPT